MSDLAKKDASLAELLSSPRYPCEGKSCANCSYQGWETGDELQPGGIYCNHPVIGVECDDEEAGHLLLQEYVESQGGVGSIDEKIANVCPHYYPVMVSNCANCGRSINHPQEEWYLYGDAFCEHWGIHPVPVCSQECVEAANQKAEADAQAYEKSLLDLDEYQAQCWTEDNYQPTPDEEHLADLAFDAARERRFTHRVSRD